MSRENKVVFIEYRYENGEIRRATGDDADAIERAIADAFMMNQIHGGRYSGPTLKVVNPGDEQITEDTEES